MVLQAQTTDRYVQEVLKETEQLLKIYGDSMIHGSTQGIRVFALTRFIPLFRSTLHYPEAFNYAFDSLPFLKKLMAPHRQFRIFTWAIPFNDGSFRHYGVILRRHSKDSVQVLPLYDHFSELVDAHNILTASVGRQQWPGAIYYDIRCFDSEAGKSYCLLLGWNGTSPHKLRRRIIEPIHWEGDTVVFGLPVLVDQRGVHMREMLEYHPTATLTLRFDNKDGQPAIVFDHLVHQRIPTGEDGFVPDGTYDYYILGNDGKWYKRAFFFGKGPTPSQSTGR